MLGFGAVNTLSKKIQNQSVSVGIDGKSAPFSKPWSQTLVMFSGEACLIFVFLIQEYLQRRSQRLLPGASSSSSLNPVESEVLQPLLASPSQGNEIKKETPTWKTYAPLPPTKMKHSSSGFLTPHRRCRQLLTCLQLLPLDHSYMLGPSWDHVCRYRSVVRLFF